MAEPDFTQCFAEGFRYKKEIEDIRNQVLAIREFEERETATPLAVAMVKDMETNLRARLKRLAENRCVTSRELENAIRFHTTVMQTALRKKPKNWLKISNRLIYLEGLLSQW